MAFVVMIVRVFLEEIRVDIQLGVQVEAAQVEHLRNRDIAEVHGPLRGPWVHVFQAVDQRVGFVLGHQVRLADEDLVGKAHLAAGFLAVVELLGGVLRIDQRQDGVEQVSLGDFVIHEESLRNGAGVGQARRFDDDPVEIQQALALLGSQQLERGAKVFANGAADAAVAHLDDLLLAFRDKDVGVDVLFAEFVLDHGDLLAMGFTENALEQRGLAGAEKAGEDGGGNETHDGHPKTSKVGQFSGQPKAAL